MPARKKEKSIFFTVQNKPSEGGKFNGFLLGKMLGKEKEKWFLPLNFIISIAITLVALRLISQKPTITIQAITTLSFCLIQVLIWTSSWSVNKTSSHEVLRVSQSFFGFVVLVFVFIQTWNIDNLRQIFMPNADIFVQVKYDKNKFPKPESYQMQMVFGKDTIGDYKINEYEIAKRIPIQRSYTNLNQMYFILRERDSQIVVAKDRRPINIDTEITVKF